MRTVEVSEAVALHGKGGGGRMRLWGYGYADLAGLFGCGEREVREMVRRGTLEPGRLDAVVAEAVRRLGMVALAPGAMRGAP